MIDAITQLVNASSGSTQGTTAAKEMGKDQFLQLLVAQLQNQNPLDPAKDTEFVAQLATFSSLEQLMSVNKNLAGLATGQANLVNSQALTLIGKDALVEAGGTVRVQHGKPDDIVYAIGAGASTATVKIVDAQGVVRRVIELDPKRAGRVDLGWDGRDGNGDLLADGEYEIRIEAKDASGEAVPAALWRSLPIDGVNFESGSVALVSGDREIPFDSIVEIRSGRE